MAGLVKNNNNNNGDNNNKQASCLSGFLQIFDRQHILAGKRLHSAKRLPPPSTVDVGASPETVSSVESRESLDGFQSSLSENVNGKQKSLKSGNEMARHSLDSRAIVDSKGGIRRKDVLSSDISSECTSSNSNRKPTRSPSVIARLMGLELLSSSDQKLAPNVVKPELRRSASESRVSRDVVRSKYIDRNNFQVKLPNQSQKQTNENVESVNGLNSECSKRNGWKSRSFFDSNDFFPERNQTTVSPVDFERKLKIRGMDEQSNDLSTLKQILEVLQLKDLLASSNTQSKRNSQTNFVYERNLQSDESSIVLMKPAHDFSRATRRHASENARKRNPVRTGNSSPNRIESNLKSCNSIVKRKPLSIEIQRRHNQSIDSLRNSPKVTPKRTNRSPKQKLVKNIVRDDELNSITEAAFTTPSTTDSKIYKQEGCKEGKSLLQRCDKLLQSLAEITESQPSLGAILPSPVSVLDSGGFDKDESTSPLDSIDIIRATSTVSDERSSPQMLLTKSTKHEEFISDDPDFIYISEILKASQYHQQNSNPFYTVEKELYNTSNVSKQHRKLVFDVIVEILDRNSELPPWKASCGSSIKHIWHEFKKIREINNAGGGVLDLISIVLEKELVESVNGWGDHPIETLETVLEIERMILKELVSEAIIDFDDFSGQGRFLRTQRRLVF